MVAGFSFLSRISKYVCEKFEIFDTSMENYVELDEEKDKKSEQMMDSSKQKSIEIKNIENPNTNNNSPVGNTSAQVLNHKV